MGIWREVTLNLLRVIAAFLFMAHGAQKLFGAFGRDPVTDLASRAGVAGILEFYGGAFILIGLFTRPVAFLLSGLMAFAYWLSHGPRGFWPAANGGELAVLYCFLYLFLSAHGGGEFSIDGWWRKRKSVAASQPE